MRKQWTKEELIAFEDHIGDLYMDNQLPFLFHLSGGNEDQLIEIFKDIKEGDYVISNHRNHYHALLHGIPPDVVEDRIKNGRSMFIYDRKRNFFVSAIISEALFLSALISPETVFNDLTSLSISNILSRFALSFFKSNFSLQC